LIKVAELLKKSTRKRDIVTRFGGDEFIIILPGTHKEDAIYVARRIKEMLENFSFIQQDSDIQITASMGIASYPDHADSKERLIELADFAMYQAKRSKNQITIARDHREET